ncbi:MAG: ion transporter [Lentisphaerae bacterium]|nr:ion transporter [Lentisphaerota bacterium]
MYRKFKQIIFEVIQPAENGRIASKIFDLTILGFILLSVISVFITTFDLPREYQKSLQQIEHISLIVFSVEYLLRIWTADLLYPGYGFFRSRIRYVFSGMALIDLLAILPFYLPMFLPVNLIGIRAIRLVRLLRLLKLNRYSDALASIGAVFKSKSKEIFASLFFVFILLVVASLLIYYAEHDTQPEQFQNAFSGLWWAVATLTTVGYGDIYPITPIGRFLGAIIALLGIGMVAVPTSILSAGFMEVLHKSVETPSNDEKKDPEPPAEEKSASETAKKYCPYCGKKLD